MVTIFGNPRSGSADLIVSESNQETDLNEKHTESQEKNSIIFSSYLSFTFCDADTLSMKPVKTDVTTDHKPKVNNF
jgi:hypothetical protein